MNCNRIISFLTVVFICGVCFVQAENMTEIDDTTGVTQQLKIIEREFKETAAKMGWDDRMVSYIAGLAENDKKLTSKFDMPADALRTAATDKILLHIIESPMTVMASIYNSPEVGLQRLINGSITMREFYTRGDLMAGTLKMYAEYEFSPAKTDNEGTKNELGESVDSLPIDTGNMKIVSICMPVYRCDQMMMCEQLFRKTKGHEKEFLKVLADRYDKVSELESLYGNDTDPFGSATASIWPMSVRLAENIDEELCEKLKSTQYKNDGWQEKFIGAIREYLAEEVVSL
jgi:hypothetical protein